MTVFLYARVSTIEQNTDLQEIALKKAYPTGVYREEKKSGTKLAGRKVLELLLDMIEPGNKLVVFRLDRLARSVGDLVEIIGRLREKSANLEILDQNIDTGTASGKAFLMMLGVFSEFESNLRSERQLAGIAAARARGKHLGRKSILSDKQKQEVRVKSETGINPTRLSKEYGVSRGTVYSILKNTVPGPDLVEFQMELPVGVSS